MRKSVLVERLLAEKDATIAHLRDELEWHRARSTAAIVAPYVPPVDEEGQPIVGSPAEWDSEFDEAQKIIEANGLSPAHLPEILDGLGLSESDFI